MPALSSRRGLAAAWSLGASMAWEAAPRLLWKLAAGLSWVCHLSSVPMMLPATSLWLACSDGPASLEELAALLKHLECLCALPCLAKGTCLSCSAPLSALALPAMLRWPLALLLLALMLKENSPREAGLGHHAARVMVLG